MSFTASTWPGTRTRPAHPSLPGPGTSGVSAQRQSATATASGLYRAAAEASQFRPWRYLLRHVSAQYPTCYESEVQEEGARLCLRFDQNFGKWEEARWMRLPAARQTRDGRCLPENLLEQRQFLSRPSGGKRFDVAHGHYHFGASVCRACGESTGGTRRPAANEEGGGKNAIGAKLAHGGRRALHG